MEAVEATAPVLPLEVMMDDLASSVLLNLGGYLGPPYALGIE